MFEASDPEVVLDLNGILPPQGENRSVSTFGRGVLDVDIFFDDEHSEGERGLRISFEEVASVSISQTPGIDVTQLACSKSPGIGSLIEYRESKAATEWSSYRHWRERKTRHYQLVLLEDVHRLDVFAAGFCTHDTPRDVRE